MTLRVRRLSDSDAPPPATTPSTALVASSSAPFPTVPPPSVSLVLPAEAMHDGQIDTAWALRTLQLAAEEKQFLMREVGDSVAVLRVLAIQLCKHEWEKAVRAGEKPEEWGATRLGNLIREVVPHKMELVAIASDLELPKKYAEAMSELNRVNAKNENLAQQYSDARRLLERLTPDAAKLNQQLARAKRDGGGRDGGSGRDDSRSARRNDIRVTDNQAASLPAVAAQSSTATQQASTSTSATPAESSVNVLDELVKFMAETGLSRSKEIKEGFASYLGEKFNRRKSPTNVRDDLTKLVKQNLLIQYEIQLERRGQSRGYMYELSDNGIRRAKELGMSPVESEVKKGKKTHDTLEHFYQILDMGDVLRAAGYKVSLYEGAVAFQDGTKYIPDIKAVDHNDRIIYVEVERTPINADELEQKYVRAAVLCNGDLFIGVVSQIKARKVGSYALEIKARRGNAIKHIFMLNVGDKESAILWKEIEQLSDLGLEQSGETDPEDDQEGSEN